MPKKSKPAKRRPLYKQKPPKGKAVKASRQDLQDLPHPEPPVHPVKEIGQPIPAAPFELREDGSIRSHPQIAQNSADGKNKSASIGEIGGQPSLVFHSDTPGVRLYHGNCLELLDAIAAKYPEGHFDAIFADPPYFLSNGGITCHFGES